MSDGFSTEANHGDNSEESDEDIVISYLNDQENHTPRHTPVDAPNIEHDTNTVFLLWLRDHACVRMRWYGDTAGRSLCPECYSELNEPAGYRELRAHFYAFQGFWGERCDTCHDSVAMEYGELLDCDECMDKYLELHVSNYAESRTPPTA